MASPQPTRPPRRPRILTRRPIALKLVLIALVALWSFGAATTKAPEVTSTHLSMHKLYMVEPPHDTTLYDVLQVPPNATHAEISKSYRKLCLKFHPDKRRRRTTTTGTLTGNDEHSKPVASKNNDDERLYQIQQAYDILSKDAKRLPYHKYGLIDPNQAVFLLMGSNLRLDSHHHLPHLDQQLLLLLGYDASLVHLTEEEMGSWRSFVAINNDSPPFDYRNDPDWVRTHRIRIVAAHLVEQIRPLVEGRVDAAAYQHQLTVGCDSLKTLPMGAHILRCVGRAYRHAGRDFLESHHWSPSMNHHHYREAHRDGVRRLPSRAFWQARQRFRDARYFATAAWASGRAAIMEHQWKSQQQKLERHQKRRQQQRREQLEYKGEFPEEETFNDDMTEDESDSFLPIMMNEDDYDDGDLEEELKLLEQMKAQETLMQSQQLEALWKVTKIDLDRVVREACNMILTGEYFFQPSHQAIDHRSLPSGDNIGWVSSSGTTMEAHQARLMAAEAMVLTGDIMVRRSKEGTAWKG